MTHPGPRPPGSPEREPSGQPRRPHIRLMAAVGVLGAVALTLGALAAFTTDPAIPLPENMPTLPSRPGTFPLPSGLPTGLPSDFPTDLPSDLPTALPSGFPTELPSDFPTELPSDFPTDLPPDFPTGPPGSNPFGGPR
ncbi:hypothetical protein ACIGXA_22410 [Streptomyces fildesensis]|uniref:Uncharacterized protein n=1 Tax=Streptomyces fildesensis TaxID=375757 RepID=A0ABW8CCZ6_9ACTN